MWRVTECLEPTVLWLSEYTVYSPSAVDLFLRGVDDKWATRTCRLTSLLCPLDHFGGPLSVCIAEVGKVTLKSNGDEALSDEFLLKSNSGETLNDGFPQQ